MRRHLRNLALLVAFLSLACEAPTDPLPFEPAGGDGGAALDAGAVDAGTPPDELTFRFRYLSDVAGEGVFLQSGGGGIPWVRVFDARGEDVRIDANCELCPCDACGNCPVCGSAPLATEWIPSGGSIERRWDLTTHRADRCAVSPGATATCEAYAPLEPGRYTARFCFGYSATEVAAGSWIEAPICRDEPFTWPTAQTVIEHEECDCG
ncbi:MAG: hypothetical protein IT384_20935 [Deltaproteobacteria bacterium]|nr:hypothetical protein [Deltaproteobacteria bacterium]